MRPDAEKIIGKFLRESDVQRVVGKTPDDTSQSWVKLVQLDASSDHRSDHLVEYLLQLDCYAGEDQEDEPGAHGQPEASLLGRTVAALMVALPNETFTDVVVTRSVVTGPSRVPDSDLEPARERTIVVASVWMHSK